MTLKAERLSIDGPVGALEAVVEDPQGHSANFAVVCHPHPQFGGTMDNKVVTTLARALHDCGIPTLRFNYRGVGQSAGSYDGGRGESDDALRVAAWAAQRWQARSLIAAGFSFGGMVAFNLALAARAARLITVAPAIQRFAPQNLVPQCPWLIVQGDADEVVDPRAVPAWAGTLEPPPRVVVAAGAGHFFHGHLAELREAVVADIRNG